MLNVFACAFKEGLAETAFLFQVIPEGEPAGHPPKKQFQPSEIGEGQIDDLKGELVSLEIAAGIVVNNDSETSDAEISSLRGAFFHHCVNLP